MEPASPAEIDGIIADLLADDGGPLYVCFNNKQYGTRALGPVPAGSMRPDLHRWAYTIRREAQMLDALYDPDQPAKTYGILTDIDP